MADGYKDFGIVVRTVDYKEADKIVSVVTRTHGLSSYIALGARRNNSKKSPHLDLFNLIKFEVGRGAYPPFILQVDTEKYFTSLKSDFAKIRLCLTFAEIIYQILPENEEDPETYTSFLNFLSAIDKAEDIGKANSTSRQFGLYLIRHFGYPPPRHPEKDNLAEYFETIINKKIIGQEIR